MAVSAASTSLNELYWTDGNAVVSFATRSLQPEAKSTMRISCAALLCRVYRHTGEEKFLVLPSKPPGAQQGSRWRRFVDYGEASQQWIDNSYGI